MKYSIDLYNEEIHTGEAWLQILDVVANSNYFPSQHVAKLLIKINSDLFKENRSKLFIFKFYKKYDEFVQGFFTLENNEDRLSFTKDNLRFEEV